MPKPSTTHAVRGSGLISVLLNQNNLAQHTQHHQELDESRDFVQEFLDTLDPLSAPQTDPGLEPVELTPDIVLRSPNAVSKPRTHESMQHQQRHQQRQNIRSTQQSSQNHQSQQHQQHQQNKYQQATLIQQQHRSNNTQDKSKRKKVIKSHQEPLKRPNESRLILQDERKHLIDGTRRNEGNGTVMKEDTRKGKKRKQAPEDVEEGVQNLEIRDPYTNHSSSREKRICQTEGTITQLKGPTVDTDKQAKNRLVLGGRHASNQQDEDKRNDKGRRTPLHDFADNQSDNGYNHHSDRHQRHYLPTALRQTSNTAVNRKSGKKDSNKPRKILTQSSLIMNQFVPPNITKGRITIPGKLDHLGIFKKGKASKKTTVQQDLGNKFSEDAFLNKRTDSKEFHISGRRQDQVVTSSYFADAMQDQYDLAVSRSSSSFGNMSNCEQPNSTSIAPSIGNTDTKSGTKERVIALTHRIDHDLHDRRAANGIQSPTQPAPAKHEPLQQPVPDQYTPTAAPFADSYNEPYPYGYLVLPSAPWQLEPSYGIHEPHQQQVYPVCGNTASDKLVPPTCPCVFHQRLHPIEYAVMDTDAEYDHGRPLLDGNLSQPLSPPANPHFRWRPHRLF
ncbi:hypothetical protein EC991_010752 [Linnemannia zychae]|nr:hypothetical protein EC991_010752 [Linnemannia zychae]